MHGCHCTNMVVNNIAHARACCHIDDLSINSLGSIYVCMVIVHQTSYG